MKTGFTLIEIMISGVLLVVVGALFTLLQSSAAQNQLSVWDQHTTINQVNDAVRDLSYELRVMRAAENGTYPLETVNDNEIAFYTNVDDDEETERVRYFLSGTSLMKGTIQPLGFPATYPSENETFRTYADTVVIGLTPLFVYYQRGWPEDGSNPLPQAERRLSTGLIDVSLTLESDTDTPPYSLNTYIHIRNDY